MYKENKNMKQNYIDQNDQPTFRPHHYQNNSHNNKYLYEYGQAQKVRPFQFNDSQRTSPLYDYTYPSQIYNNSHEQNPQNPFIQQSFHYVPEINTKEILQTIFNTSQLVQKTKKYVENIPIKSQFYHSYQSQSKQEPLTNSRFYTKVPLQYTYLTQNPKRERQFSSSLQNQKITHDSIVSKKFTHPKQSQFVQAQKQKQKKIRVSFKDFQGSQIKQQHPKSDNQTYQQILKPSTHSQQIQPEQQTLQSTQRNQILIQTFRPIVRKIKNDQQKKQIEKPKTYQKKQIQTVRKDKVKNVQFTTPSSKLRSSNQKQQAVTTTGVKSTSFKKIQRSPQNKQISKLLRSPLTKTFQAYSNFSYSSSNSSSARSSGNSGNKIKNSSNKKYSDIHKSSKQSPKKDNKKVESSNEKIASNQVIRYFKKKDQVHSHISSFSPRSNHNGISLSIKQRSKSKSPQNKIRIDQNMILQNQLLSSQSAIEQQKITLQDIQKVKSKYVTPLERSPRDQYYQNPHEHKHDKQNDFVRQCCTPFSRLPSNSKKQIQLSIVNEQHNSMKSKNQSPKHKVQAKKLSLNNEAIYPFQNLQTQYHTVKTQEAPTVQISAKKSSNPITPSNKKSIIGQQQIFSKKDNTSNYSELQSSQQKKDTRDNIKKVSSRYIQKQEQQRFRQKSPQIQEYYSVQYNNEQRHIENYYSPVNKNINFENQQQPKFDFSKAQLSSPTGRRKQGIKVLLNNYSPQEIKVQKIHCQIPLKNQNTQNQITVTNVDHIKSSGKKSSPKKKRYLQISIQRGSSQDQQKSAIKRNHLQKLRQNEITKQYEKIYQKQDKLQQIKQKQGNKTIVERINEQIIKIQMLNKVDKETRLKEHTLSKQKLRRGSDEQSSSLRSSKKFQRTNSNSKYVKKLQLEVGHYIPKKENGYEVQLNKTLPQNSFKKHQNQDDNSSNTQKRNHRLNINHINDLVIQPSSLQKYNSQTNSHHQSKQSLAYDQILNNTISFTTPQKYDKDTTQKDQDNNADNKLLQKSQKIQKAQQKSHIMRLQKSMQKLERQFKEKNKNRKKIFNQLLQSQKYSNNKKKLYQTAQKELEEQEKMRIQRLYKREIKNHNKTLQSKLYHLLVEQDTVSKRPSQKKNKFSPIKQRTPASGKNQKQKNKRFSSKIFDSQPSKFYTTTPSSRKASPRQEYITKFNYKPMNEHQRSFLCRSVQNFQQTPNDSHLDRNSVQRILDQQLKTDRKTIQRYEGYTKLNEDEIRRQIKKIKQYDFIQRYMTNYQLQQIMRDYIHRSIPPRKWSLMIIDQVYKRIRAKQQKR